ncbi:MAG: ABC transporter substrate-binding protein [Polyangiaceae bacterium]|jgi:iron complex transport system substrate-binding protein
MTSLTTLNGAAFSLAFILSTAVAWQPRVASRDPTGPAATDPRSGPSALAASSVRAPLIDHSGTAVPRRDYRRIASGSSVSDALLLDLCEPDRIAAFTAYSARRSTSGFRYAGKPVIERIEDVEFILALHPDLVVVSGMGDPRPLARLRDAGIAVFDLGDMRGLSTLIPNAIEVAALVGHPDRGERLARTLVEEMNGVDVGVPRDGRRRAIYLSAIGASLFGGAAGTSYHDVLVAAGLIDAASGYAGWPQYTTEEVLALDPDIIVTNEGMRDRLCGRSLLSSLRACRHPEAIVEMDAALLGDPGPAMVDAAREVRAAVYGPSKGAPRP